MSIKTLLSASVVLACSTFFAQSVLADQITASCASISNISGGEADFLYYEAEGELGSQEAGRLWGLYHRLKDKCARNPNARIVVSVEPRVKAFFEARR